MKSHPTFSLVVGLALATIVTPAGWFSSAEAGPVSVRTVAVSGAALQDSIDDITVGGLGINVATDQDSTAWFTGTSSGGSIATFITGASSGPIDGRFGLYDTSDPSNRAIVFDSSVSAGDQARVSFLANGDIQVNGGVVATGFDDPKSFGYFFEVFDSNTAAFNGEDIGGLGYTVYTDDELNNIVNPLGDARVLVFRGDGQTQLQLPTLVSGQFKNNEFLLAFENGSPSSSVSDFADFLVMVESVAPIPEPATGLLLALGLGAVCRRHRGRG